MYLVDTTEEVMPQRQALALFGNLSTVATVSNFMLNHFEQCCNDTAQRPVRPTAVGLRSCVLPHT